MYSLDTYLAAGGAFLSAYGRSLEKAEPFVGKSRD